MVSRRLPSIFYNWITLIGALVGALSFIMIVLLYLIDTFVQGTTIYLGLVTFIILPVFVLLGMLLIAVGALVEHRRRARGRAPNFSLTIQIDLRNPAHVTTLLIWAVGTVVFLLASSAGTYRAYQATESVEFCGQLCHSVMHPEFTAYQTSPHARVACVDCHIGSGAKWFVQAKLSGVYQVYATLAHVYPRPVPTPIENLRPARETCEQCHWPEQFFGARKSVNPHFLADEENTPYPITMLINTGGGSEALGRAEGIHWHMSLANKIEYVARDRARQEIVQVRMTQRDGRIVEYNHTEDPMSEQELAQAEFRTMDCIDCHNRPSHIYRSPVRAVNQAMAVGWIDRGLPYIKREAVSALDQDYPNTSTALQSIENKLQGFYREEYPEISQAKGARLDAAVAAVQRIYEQNFFPEMKVSWKRYPDNIGHSEFVGCFRCHGDVLQTTDGKTISKDCTICHTILAQGLKPEPGAYAPTGLTFRHPEDIDGAELEGNCTECHEGGSELY